MIAARNAWNLETCICCSFKISEFMAFPLSRRGIYSLLHLTKSVKTRVYVDSIPMSSISSDNSYKLVSVQCFQIIIKCSLFPDNYN